MTFNYEIEFFKEIHRKALRLFKRCINKNTQTNVYCFSYEEKLYDITVVKRNPLVCALSESNGATILLDSFSAQSILEAVSSFIIRDIYES